LLIDSRQVSAGAGYVSINTGVDSGNCGTWSYAVLYHRHWLAGFHHDRTEQDACCVNGRCSTPV